MKNLDERTNKISNGAFNIFRNFVFASLLASNLAIVSCGDNDGRNDSTHIEKKDTTPPKINIKKFGNVDVTGGKKITVSGNKIYIGDKILGNELVADINDEESGITKIEMYIETDEGKEKISSGYVADKDCVLHIVCYNGNNLTANGSIPLTTNAPKVDAPNDTVNVFFGGKIEVLEKSLSIGGEEVARWDRGNLISIVFEEDGLDTKRDLKSGDNLNTSGTLWLTVKDKKETTIELHIDNRSIEGLESLKNLDLQAGQTVNLGDYIRPKEGFKILENVKVKGDDGEIQTKFSEFCIPEPGNFTLSFVVCKAGDENRKEPVEFNNLKVKEQPYNEPKFNQVNLNKVLPGFNNLRKKTQEFLEPYVITSTIVSNRFNKNDRKVHFVAGENINQPGHGKEGADRIRLLSTNVDIKGNDPDSRAKNIYEYSIAHPDKQIIVSCAIGPYNDNDLRKLLERDNVLVITANGDINNKYRFTDSENVTRKEVGNGLYKAECSDKSAWIIPTETKRTGVTSKASVRSKKNNKIAVCGWNPDDKYNVFGPDGGLGSNMPHGSRPNDTFGMVPGLTSGGIEDYNSDSSYPTASVAAALGNLLNIVSYSNPKITMPQFMDMVNKHLDKKRFKYIDENTGNENDGGYVSVINCKSFIEDQVLHIDEIRNAEIGSDFTKLPSNIGVIYTGKGVQFSIDGALYYGGVNESNIGDVIKAWNDGKTVVWMVNNKIAKRQGGSGKEVNSIVINGQGEIVLKKAITIGNTNAKKGINQKNKSKGVQSNKSKKQLTLQDVRKKS